MNSPKRVYIPATDRKLVNLSKVTDLLENDERVRPRTRVEARRMAISVLGHLQQQVARGEVVFTQVEGIEKAIRPLSR